MVSCSIQHVVVVKCGEEEGDQEASGEKTNSGILEKPQAC